MKFRRLLFVLTVLAVVALPFATLAAQRPSTGTFYIDTSYVYPTPVAGSSIRFYTQTPTPLPQNGGDTKALWVETKCYLPNGTQVLDWESPGDQPVIPNVDTGQYWAYLFLESAEWLIAEHAQAQCVSYLFWDGYQSTRRTKTNTLAGPLMFTAAQGVPQPF